MEELQGRKPPLPKDGLLAVLDTWTAGLFGLRALIDGDMKVREHRDWILAMVPEPPDEKSR